MNEHFDILNSVELFEGIEPSDLALMLDCVDAIIKGYSKGDILMLAGSKPLNVGVVISGEIHISREDIDGNRSLIAVITPGQIFAEALCCADVQESPVTVTAGTGSSVMLLNFSRLLRTCTNSCAFHSRLIQNMLEVIAKKNLLLQNRMDIISLKSIRAKILRYLNTFSPQQNREITIPFNREQLADFLCADRSALSHELARMKRDGLIEYRKNKFTVIQAQLISSNE